MPGPAIFCNSPGSKGVAVRFRVVKDSESIKLEGPITDTTVFGGLEDFKNIKTKVDLRSITCASLTGMRNLDGKLCDLSIDYEFVSVPFAIFQVIQLCDFRDRVTTFECIRAASRANGEVVFEVTEGFNDSTGASTEVMLADGSISIAFHGAAAVSPASMRPYLTGWAQQNLLEAGFWLDYLGFLGNTLLQCQQIIASTVVAVTRSLRMLDLRIQSFDAAWNTMGLPSRKGSWPGKEAIAETEKNAAQITVKIQETLHIARERIGFLLLRFAGENVENCEKSIFTALAKLEKYGPLQALTGGKIEDAGCALGELLMSIDTFSSVRADLNQAMININQEVLAKVIEQIGIMNPMAESDVAEAIAEIVAEATAAQDELSGGVVMVQAFDLVRQIMEHRRNEIAIILQRLPDYISGNMHWTMLRDLVIDKLTGKLVTEHEKQAFEFYLGYLNPARGSKGSAPGDLELF
jgi:hypothetical protein